MIRSRRFKQGLLLLAVVAVGLFIVGAVAGRHRIALWFLPDFASWPINPAGYEVETLPFDFSASFVRGNDVYFVRRDGSLWQADDRQSTLSPRKIGKPLTEGARQLFVSSEGVIFVSRHRLSTLRSADGGQTWTECLPAPGWRMDEGAGALFQGNYGDAPPATVYRSTDAGLTWQSVWRHRECEHVHTVRWDAVSGGLFIAYGDKPSRGQSVSWDGGQSFHVLVEGPGEGHTDVAFTNDFILWGSDDQTGRILQVERTTGRSRTLMGRSQYIWWLAAEGHQVYAGTMTSNWRGGERPAILASSDQGVTWQKLIEGQVSKSDYEGYEGESRNLSAAGWVYFSDATTGYRVRLKP